MVRECVHRGFSHSLIFLANRVINNSSKLRGRALAAVLRRQPEAVLLVKVEVKPVVQRVGLCAVLALERLEALLAEPVALPPVALAVVSPAVVALDFALGPTLGVVLGVRQLELGWKIQHVYCLGYLGLFHEDCTYLHNLHHICWVEWLLSSLQCESHAAGRVGHLAHLATVKDPDVIGVGVLDRQ